VCVCVAGHSARFAGQLFGVSAAPAVRFVVEHRARGAFPTDEAATRLIYLAIRNFETDGRNVREWFAARNQFAIKFGARFDA